ncbi:isopenicillin N synthase family oxygenase [Variovorax sp. PCZ-1]|nr:isopenicillin N synthase family oxygenase [Variovorax sp. PCZ-1]
MNMNPVLPIVDFTSPDAPRAFCESLHRTGFGVLKNHPLSSELVHGIYDEWLRFFQSGDAQKYTWDPVKLDGHFSTAVSETAKGNDIRDFKEFFHLFPWGRYPAEVSDAARRYYGLGKELAATLLKWVEDNSPEDIRSKYSVPLASMIDDCEETLLRVLHYPPLNGEQAPNSIRAAAHTDINLLTILPAATEPGLQVMGTDGVWIDAPSDFGLLIVNIGDMLEEASGHYYPSTQHRVLNPVGEGAKKSRVSLPLFLHPRREIKLSERYTVGSYFEERMQELRRKG